MVATPRRGRACPPMGTCWRGRGAGTADGDGEGSEDGVDVGAFDGKRVGVDVGGSVAVGACVGARAQESGA